MEKNSIFCLGENYFEKFEILKKTIFEIKDQKVYAEFEIGREESNKISSVHYIQFNFNTTAKAAFLENPESVKLIINYKNCLTRITYLQ